MRNAARALARRALKRAAQRLRLAAAAAAAPMCAVWLNRRHCTVDYWHDGPM
jgi:hypothetical protein